MNNGRGSDHDLPIQLLAAVPNESLHEYHGFAPDTFQARPLPIADG
jgi:hypothetical protein